tara:strand:+ start:1448 stop:1681 length:234 start_codon:yes stop_codon:yes gene_type:complete
LFKSKRDIMISIYRYINDISLNGREYLLDEDDETLLFSSKDKAFEFLTENGIEVNNEEDLEDYGIFLNKEIEGDDYI